MSKIIVYNNGLRQGSTSNAFSDICKEELMREYTLQFSIVNTDSIFPLINENSVFERKGQLFEVSSIDIDSGDNDITQILAEHISYRLNNYAILAGYAFTGTLREILQDILNIAENIDTGKHASDEFNIGSLPEIDTVFSFRMKNTAEATARDALISLSQLGFEIIFNNHNIDVVNKRGSDKGFKLEFSKNLAQSRRRFQKGNGWSYEFTAYIRPGDVELGDIVEIDDTNLNIKKKERVITIEDCADDPSQTKIVTGVFILDSATQSVETDRIAYNAVQQNEKYSNVYINHSEGFVAENKAGTQRVIMNGDDCFSVQVINAQGQWETVTSTEPWGIAASRLTSQEAKDDFYFCIGKTEDNDYGLEMVTKQPDGTRKPTFRIKKSTSPLYAGRETFFDTCGGKLIIWSDIDENPLWLRTPKQYRWGAFEDLYLRDVNGKQVILHIEGGMIKSIER